MKIYQLGTAHFASTDIDSAEDIILFQAMPNELFKDGPTAQQHAQEEANGAWSDATEGTERQGEPAPKLGWQETEPGVFRADVYCDLEGGEFHVFTAILATCEVVE